MPIQVNAQTINLAFVANALQAYKHCIKHNSPIWEDKHADRLNKLLAPLPQGSGFDDDVVLIKEESTLNKLVFRCNYHHLENGYYRGWTSHKAIVTPSFLGGFDIKITGQNKNEIKSYISDVLHSIFYVSFDEQPTI